MASSTAARASRQPWMSPIAIVRPATRTLHERNFRQPNVPSTVALSSDSLRWCPVTGEARQPAPHRGAVAPVGVSESLLQILFFPAPDEQVPDRSADERVRD